MTKIKPLRYMPDYVVPPRNTIKELVEYSDITESEVIEKVGHDIINNDIKITEDIALKLEHMFNLPVKFWLNLEANYRMRA